MACEAWRVGDVADRERERDEHPIGPVRLTLYLVCSASFFNRNSVFLLQQFSRNSVFQLVSAKFHTSEWGHCIVKAISLYVGKATVRTNIPAYQLAAAARILVLNRGCMFAAPSRPLVSYWPNGVDAHGGGGGEVREHVGGEEEVDGAGIYGSNGGSRQTPMASYITMAKRSASRAFDGGHPTAAVALSCGVRRAWGGGGARPQARGTWASDSGRPRRPAHVARGA